MTTVLVFVVVLSMYFAKAPILALYIRLFGVKPWVRYTCYITLAATLLQLLAAAALVGASCAPLAKEGFKSDKTATCLASVFNVGIWNGLVSVITDIIALVIPILIVMKLHLPLHKRIGLGFVFLSGVL